MMKKNRRIQKSQRYSSTYSTTSSSINEIITLIQQNNKKQLPLIQKKITHFLQAPSEDIARQTQRLVQATQRLDKNAAWRMLMTLPTCLKKLNHHPAALEIYDHPQLKNQAPAQIAKAHCLCDMGKHQKALAVYKQPLLKHNTTALIVQARCLQEMGMHQKALTIYKQPLLKRNATALTSQARCLQEMARYNDALVTYDQLLLQTYPTTLISKAKCLREMGDNARALQLYDQPLLQHNIDAQIAKGRCLEEMGCYEQALDTYSKPLLENNAIALVTKGRCLKNMKQYHEALGVLQVPRLQSNTNALLGIAYCYRAMDDKEAAVQAFTHPQLNHQLHAGLGLAWMHIEEHTPASLNEAVQQLEKISQDHPYEPTVYLALSEAYRYFGALNNAPIQGLKNACALLATKITPCTDSTPSFPHHKELRQRLGNYYLLQGNIQKAGTLYHEAIEQFPYHTPFYLKLIQCYLLQKNTDEVLRWATRFRDQFAQAPHQTAMLDELLTTYGCFPELLPPRSHVSLSQNDGGAVLPYEIRALDRELQRYNQQQETRYYLYLYGSRVIYTLTQQPVPLDTDYDLVTNLPQGLIKKLFPSATPHPYIERVYDLNLKTAAAFLRWTNETPDQFVTTLDFTCHQTLATIKTGIMKSYNTNTSTKQTLQLIGSLDRYTKEPLLMLRAIYCANRYGFILHHNDKQYIQDYTQLHTLPPQAFTNTEKGQWQHFVYKLFCHGQAVKNYQSLCELNLLSWVFPITTQTKFIPYQPSILSCLEQLNTLYKQHAEAPSLATIIATILCASHPTTYLQSLVIREDLLTQCLAIQQSVMTISHLFCEKVKQQLFYYCLNQNNATKGLSILEALKTLSQTSVLETTPIPTKNVRIIHSIQTPSEKKTEKPLPLVLADRPKKPTLPAENTVNTVCENTNAMDDGPIEQRHTNTEEEIEAVFSTPVASSGESNSEYLSFEENDDELEEKTLATAFLL